MIHLKLYLKILRKHFPQTLIYIAFFLIITIVSAHDYWGNQDYKKPYKVYWVSEEETNFVDGMKEYLGQDKDIEIKDLPKVHGDLLNQVEMEPKRLDKLIDEAIIEQVVDCVIKVPKGFSQSLSSKEPMPLEIISRMSGEEIQNIDERLKDYIDKSQRQKMTQNGILNRSSKEDTDSRRVSHQDEAYRKQEILHSYFDALVYGLSAVILIGIMSVTYSMNNKTVSARRSSAPMESRDRFILLKCHFLFGALSLAAFILFGFFFGGQYMFSKKVFLWSLNAGLLMCIIVMVGYLCSFFVKSVQVQIIITNLLTLGCMFVSGIIMEQDTQSALTMKIAQFLPTYWYVRGNALIDKKDIGQQYLDKDLVYCVGIELLFLAAFIVLALIAWQGQLDGRRGEEE